jgi:hypothetical protein
METEGGGHEGSAVDEVDMVIRVLGSRDEEIEQGVGNITPNGR